MTHGSLFSGVGGFDLAAEWAGFENLFHCELNQFCQKVLKHHFPNSESYGDITKTDFRKWRGKIDVLSGGFPCQPFSVAGSRKGADDDRYLWPQMLRAIEEIRPTWVIGENVAGILSMVLPGEEVKVGDYTDITGESYKEIEERQMYVVERICQDFEHIGYSVQPIVIPACAVGAPHRRDRVWFVAHHPDARNKTQCTGKDGIFTAGFTANSILRRHERRTEETYSRREETIGERLFCEVERLGKSRTATNSDSEECKNRIENRRRKNYQEIKTRMDIGAERPCILRGVANSDKLNVELSRLCSSEVSEQQATGLFGNMLDWNNFPTQSPVCDRNDGIPLGLAGISFPKWRVESIKALGNAIVPQVAYEIFKTIKI